MQVAASFLRIQYPAHASAYLSCNCSLYQTPSPRLGLPVLQLFPLPNTQPTPRLTCPATVPSAKHPAHASAYLSCNCSLYQTPSPRLGLPVLQLFPLPNTLPTPRLTCPATVPSAKHPAHASAYLSCNCSLCQTPNPRRGLPVLQLFPLPNTQPTPRLTCPATVPSAKHPTAGAGSSPTNGGHPNGRVAPGITPWSSHRSGRAR